ncbi:MAG: type II and III secretion system protein [Bacteroidales bacterium]|jgi:type IV pilus assembly protein PilQ|nr:type II and III secretion system protein [Bacteroidales bacterium]
MKNGHYKVAAKARLRLRLLAWLTVSLFSACITKGQPLSNIQPLRSDSLMQIIRNLETEIPALSGRVNISVSGTPIGELVRAVAGTTGLNISIDPTLNFQVINNFVDVKASDVLLFLCERYGLRLSVIGNIIILAPPEAKTEPPRIKVDFDTVTALLTVDCDDAMLGTLAKQLTLTTGVNVIPGTGTADQKIKAYLSGLSVDNALEKIAYANNLITRKTDDGSILVEKKPAERPEVLSNSVQRPAPGQQAARQETTGTYNLTVTQLGRDSLKVFAVDAPVTELIKELASKNNTNYVLTSSPTGVRTLFVSGSSFSDLLQVILTGTGHVFKSFGESFYVIGANDVPELMEQDVIQLQYRSVDSLMAVVPKDLIAGIETIVFREQNSIMLSGPVNRINKAGSYIRMLDKLIPVVSIEVMIIDYNTSYTISTGINAGLSNSEVPPSSGKVLPSVDLNLNSQSINDLINRFNGFGWANLGYVTPSFYASIRAMENQGILKVRSTPILSTLNGHRTELSIGKTEYYLEEQINIIGTQNPQSTKIQTYKPVEAQLSVIITPVVSGDDQITLDIEVNQSDFTARISTTAPPGKVSRTFKSKIRVTNGEMVLLGGLEESRDNKTSSGIPFLSRVPVIKWIFSQRTDEKSKTKLNIFIKPTIIS